MISYIKPFSKISRSVSIFSILTFSVIKISLPSKLLIYVKLFNENLGHSLLNINFVFSKLGSSVNFSIIL
jgi:hypothetical protein